MTLTFIWPFPAGMYSASYGFGLRKALPCFTLSLPLFKGGAISLVVRAGSLPERSAPEGDVSALTTETSRDAIISLVGTGALKVS